MKIHLMCFPELQKPWSEEDNNILRREFAGDSVNKDRLLAIMPKLNNRTNPLSSEQPENKKVKKKQGVNNVVSKLSLCSVNLFFPVAVKCTADKVKPSIAGWLWNCKGNE